MQLLFRNRWNQESARRVYLNITREKPSHTPDTSHVQQLSCKLEWTNQKHFCFFFLKPFRDDLAPGFPRALDLSPRHAQKSSGSRLRNSMQPKLASRHVRIIAYWRNVWWRKVVPVCHLAEPLHWLKTRQRCHRESPLYYRCPPGEKQKHFLSLVNYLVLVS